MPSIYQTKPGVAVALSNPEDVPIPITFDGWGNFFAFKSIITQMAIERNGNYQFLHTLKDLIYVYVFGERIGQIRISGLSFADRCPGGSGKSGIENILEYYELQRIGKRASPLTIQIGTTSAGRFIGFLTSLRVDIVQPEARIAQFGLSFHTFPKAT